MSRLTVASLACLAVALLLPTPASASCAGFPPIQEHLAAADVVFTGTVVGLRNEDRTATFAVTEVWRGPDLPPEVVVHGGPDDPSSFTSVDRTFRGGMDYLVAARVVDGELVDDACSATQPWDDRLAEVRPDDARRPAGAGSMDGDAALPVLPPVLAVLFVLLVAGSLLAFRSRG